MPNSTVRASSARRFLIRAARRCGALSVVIHRSLPVAHRPPARWHSRAGSALGPSKAPRVPRCRVLAMCAPMSEDQTPERQQIFAFGGAAGARPNAAKAQMVIVTPLSGFIIHDCPGETGLTLDRSCVGRAWSRSVVRPIVVVTN